MIVAKKATDKTELALSGAPTFSKVRDVLIVDKYFTVGTQGNEIFIAKMVRRKPIKLTLTCTKNGVIVKPPKYVFVSTNSWFDYPDLEERFSRDKKVLGDFVKRLKKLGIWQHIVNKNFFSVNTKNKKLNRDKAAKAMREM